MNLDVEVGVLQMKLCQMKNTRHVVLRLLLAAPEPLEQGEVVLDLQVQLNEFGEGSNSKSGNRVRVWWQLEEVVLLLVLLGLNVLGFCCQLEQTACKDEDEEKFHISEEIESEVWLLL